MTKTFKVGMGIAIGLGVVSLGAFAISKYIQAKDKKEENSSKEKDSKKKESKKKSDIITSEDIDSLFNNIDDEKETTSSKKKSKKKKDTDDMYLDMEDMSALGGGFSTMKAQKKTHDAVADIIERGSARQPKGEIKMPTRDRDIFNFQASIEDEEEDVTETIEEGILETEVSVSNGERVEEEGKNLQEETDRETSDEDEEETDEDDSESDMEAEDGDESDEDDSEDSDDDEDDEDEDEDFDELDDDAIDMSLSPFKEINEIKSYMAESIDALFDNYPDEASHILGDTKKDKIQRAINNFPSRFTMASYTKIILDLSNSRVEDYAADVKCNMLMEHLVTIRSLLNDIIAMTEVPITVKNPAKYMESKASYILCMLTLYRRFAVMLTTDDDDDNDDTIRTLDDVEDMLIDYVTMHDYFNDDEDEDDSNDDSNPEDSVYVPDEDSTSTLDNNWNETFLDLFTSKEECETIIKIAAEESINSYEKIQDYFVGDTVEEKISDCISRVTFDMVSQFMYVISTEVSVSDDDTKRIYELYHDKASEKEHQLLSVEDSVDKYIAVIANIVCMDILYKRMNDVLYDNVLNITDDQVIAHIRNAISDLKRNHKNSYYKELEGTSLEDKCVNVLSEMEVSDILMTFYLYRNISIDKIKELNPSIDIDMIDISDAMTHVINDNISKDNDVYTFIMMTVIEKLINELIRKPSSSNGLKQHRRTKIYKSSKVNNVIAKQMSDAIHNMSDEEANALPEPIAPIDSSDIGKIIMPDNK